MRCVSQRTAKPTLPFYSTSSQDWPKNIMTMAIQRFFGVTPPQFSDSSRGNGRLTMEQLRESLQILLHDCKDMQAQRIIYKINIARTPAELWLLRSDLHQCISRAHNQTEAAQRINSLVDGFEGWMPSRQLTRI